MRKISDNIEVVFIPIPQSSQVLDVNAVSVQARLC